MKYNTEDEILKQLENARKAAQRWGYKKDIITNIHALKNKLRKYHRYCSRSASDSIALNNCQTREILGDRAIIPQNNGCGTGFS